MSNLFLFLSARKNAKPIQVANFADASNKCRAYITKNCLGSSNFTGGRIENGEGQFIARVSYNGRVWDNENLHIAKEISLK